MASTLISGLVAQARVHLNEPVAAYWADSELLAHGQNGVHDLWRKIVGQYQEHFVTIDSTNVTLPANSSQLAGVEPDVYRVMTVEPRIVGTTSTNQGLIFKNRKYTDPDFVQARAADPVTPQSTIIFYDVINPGAPVGAPLILVAPQVSVLVNIQLVYNQVLAAISLGSNNPIPGQSDNALIAWMVAYAKGKEGPDPTSRVPDPNWLAVYATEKANLIAELSMPRSSQDQEVVEAVFEDLWPDWQ